MNGKKINSFRTVKMRKNRKSVKSTASLATSTAKPSASTFASRMQPRHKTLTPICVSKPVNILALTQSQKAQRHLTAASMVGESRRNSGDSTGKGA